MFKSGTSTPATSRPRKAASLYERQQRYARAQSSAVASIGEIPPVKHPKRRKACQRDLKRFLETYFPASTGLKPFSAAHADAIRRIERCALDGGLFIQALPRGFAKTTISENAAIWAVLYGHRRFVPIFAASAEGSAGNIDSIKLELAENERLYEDFPEVCHAVRALEGKPQRCASQTYRGELTHIEWRADTIVLPTIPGSAASGAILAACSILAASRGMKHKRPDGAQQRPDFVVIDDPQTDESAATELQVRKRLDVIRKSILKLGGHSTKIAVVMNATVIRPDDLVETMLDARKFPAWQGMRIKMVQSWATAHETLWLGDYARLRNTYEPELLGDQQRAHREATEFYRRNREGMDAGCAVAWEHCYDEATELSAIQHAYNALIDDGPEVFASECQNEPPRPEKLPEEKTLAAADIAAKLNQQPRGKIDAAASTLVAFIDPKKDALFWMVCAFGEGFTGQIVDYGTWPDQRRSYFTSRQIRPTIATATGHAGLEESVYAALEACSNHLLGREWHRNDGASMKIERCLIDAHWGAITDTVRLFCRQSPHAAVLMPSHGIYLGAASARAFDTYTPKPGDRCGLHWRIPAARTRGAVRELIVDVNHWKTFTQQRLAAPRGQRGCLTLNGTKAEEHRLLADHLTSEEPTLVTAKGRSVLEWQQKASRPDNDWWDGLVGCHVAASERRITLLPHHTATRVTVKLSELQKRGKRWTPTRK